jgi:hypothetical protein
MIRFYSNKELSQAFQINLAKWKRWSREFLPPDPLGGLQSGYARQYNLDEAFRVFLGGHLVGDLKYTIPESRQILDDLHHWLIEHNFYFDFSGDSDRSQASRQSVQNYQIAIVPRKIPGGRTAGFSYWITAVLSNEAGDLDDHQIRRERVHELSIGPPEAVPSLTGVESYCVLNINALRRNFLNGLQNITHPKIRQSSPAPGAGS